MEPAQYILVEKRPQAAGGEPTPATGLSADFPVYGSMHTHQAHEIIYVVQGAARVVIGGSQYQAQAGSVVFISHLEIHRVEPLTEDYTRYFVIVPPAAVREITASDRLASIFVNRPVGFFHCLDMSGHAPYLERLFGEMHDESRLRPVLAEERLRCLLAELLIYLYRQQPEAFPVPDSPMDRVVQQVKNYLEEHYHEPLTVEELASLFYVSTSYLSHSFKRITGYSIKQYLQLRRLAEARALLYATNDSIAQIAVKSGFSDVNNFIAYFKRQVGVTPNQYRKQQRKLHPL